MGQNLGERSLPTKIDVKDYELLLQTLPNDHEAVRSVYELDASGIPCYVLRKTYFSHHDETIEDASQRLLEKMEENDFKQKCEQQYVFNGILSHCFQNFQRFFNIPFLISYFKYLIILLSALLQVAELGNDLSNENSTALWIERTIQEENTDFGDLTNDDKAELKILKQKYFRSNSSIITYDAFAKHDIMKRNNFHRTIIEKIKENVHIAAQQSVAKTITDPNLKEIAQHILKSQENYANVDESHQRTIDIQRRISTYLRANTKSPLVIHGSPGCGKSTMVSMAAKLASDKMVDGTILVLRFLGSTRYSSNLRFLLRSICFQLSRAFGNKDKIPEVLYNLSALSRNNDNIQRTLTLSNFLKLII